VFEHARSFRSAVTVKIRALAVQTVQASQLTFGLDPSHSCDFITRSCLHYHAIKLRVQLTAHVATQEIA